MSSTSRIACHLAALALLTPSVAHGQSGSGGSARLDKLHGDLDHVLRNAAPNELVPITIVLTDQVAPTDLRAAAWLPTKEDRRRYVTDLLKQKADATQDGLLNLLATEGDRTDRIKPLWIHNMVGAHVTRDIAYRISTRADVAHISYNRPMTRDEIFPVQDEQADDGGGVIAAIECGVAIMNAPQVWSDFGIDGNGIVVGVIDTGLCVTHSDIQNNVWQNPGEIAGNNIDDDNNGFIDDINGWNFQNDNNNLSDLDSHGTHVSGTVAGDGTSGEQTGTAPGADIMVLRFFNSFSGEQTVWDAMQYGVDNGADVLTASLGWPHSVLPDRVVWRNVCENSMHAGSVVMFAAGNSFCFFPPEDITTPGDVPDMITCGATDCNDQKASFSACGPTTWETISPFNDWPNPPGKLKPTVAAPGVDTLSLDRCSGYSRKSGTSMATPHIAGATALILQANPDLDHWGIKQILKETSVDLGANGPDQRFGAGRVDAHAAVVAAMEYATGARLSLEVTGSCPGTMTATVQGANPGDQIAFIYGRQTGSTHVGLCFGLFVDLDQPALLTVQTADAAGEVVVSRVAPATACGQVRVQALNVTACEKSLTRGL